MENDTNKSATHRDASEQSTSKALIAFPGLRPKSTAQSSPLGAYGENKYFN